MEITHKELHRIVTTVLIYRDDKKYLITKRSPHKKVHPNKWTIPGGGLTVDDYIFLPPSHGNEGWAAAVESALSREIKEEVGIAIDTPTYLLNFTFIRPDNIPVLVLTYYAQYISGEVTLDEDSTEYAWVTLEEAKGYDLIEGIREEIEMVDNRLKQ